MQILHNEEYFRYKTGKHFNFVVNYKTIAIIFIFICVYLKTIYELFNSLSEQQRMNA